MRGMLLLATLTYGIGQSTNFLFQLHLLHLLGSSAYGNAGLAHLLLITLIFLADWATPRSSCARLPIIPTGCTTGPVPWAKDWPQPCCCCPSAASR